MISHELNLGPKKAQSLKIDAVPTLGPENRRKVRVTPALRATEVQITVLLDRL